jgi:dipeptidyl aminopeptidase/acylaminoacyl peptidase
VRSRSRLACRRIISTAAATLVLSVVLAFARPAAYAQAQTVANAAAPPAAAQTPTAPAKKVLAVADYSRWRAIESPQISSDGKWVAYVLRYTNTLPLDSKPVLHIQNLGTGRETEVPNASNPSFSPDARWIVYQMDSIPTRAARARAAANDTMTAVPLPAAPGVPTGVPPVTPDTTAPGGGGREGGPPAPIRRTELRELATGRTQVWQDIQSAVFSSTSTHLLLRRRPGGIGGGRAGGPGGGPVGPVGPVGPGGPGAPGGPFGPDGGGAGANASPPVGTEAVLFDLTSGRGQFLGNVGDGAFTRQGDFFAYTVNAQQRDANGLTVIDLKTNRTHVLENDARIYSRLTWSDDGSGIAVLKGKPVPRMRERDNVLAVYTDLRRSLGNPELGPAVLDPAAVKEFPRGQVVSDRAPLTWSDDNARVFFGIIPQTPAPDTARRRSTDSIADVDVWRTEDTRIQSVQMIRADADRNFTYTEVFDVTRGKFILLADSTMRELQRSPDGRWAIGRDTRGYVHDYKRPAADIYRVDPTTGERKLILKGQLTGQHVFGISPDSKRFLYWKDNKYQAYDLAAATSATLGNGSAPSFVDMEFDHPGPRPSYGVAGYSSDGGGVIVEHKYDLWLLPFDAAVAPRNLTTGLGTKGEIRFRIARTEPVDSLGSRAARTGQLVDLSKPVTLSAYGEYTKRDGFYRLTDGKLDEVIYEDAAFSVPVKAKVADSFLFTRQTFVDFPDLRVSGPSFKDAKKITNANPQQAEYVWGKRILFDFKNKDGIRLQGILALPDDYKPGEKRPMLVNFYEKNSQNLHRYSAPSFLTGMGSSPIEAVSRGYITMIPDIYFHTGSSHSDMLECVEAAVKKVLEMGYVDPKRIGINGHSYGGEGAAFIGTRSRLFAAVGMGAGVTDLFTDFSQSWGWSYQVTGGSGANGNDYYLYGQGRWGVSPWEKPNLYHFESALTHVPEVTAPFLIMHGTSDPTVSFSEGMNFYNALRYNRKAAFMVAYPGEGHGLRGLANRRDLTIRYFQFFDHYLKGAPAPKWMTEEVPFLMKDLTREPR